MFHEKPQHVVWQSRCARAQGLHCLCAQDAPTPFSILPSTAPVESPTNIYTWEEAVAMFSLFWSPPYHSFCSNPHLSSKAWPPRQELCLGEGNCSAGFTVFTAFLYPGGHANPGIIFQAKAVHTIFKQPYLDNLFLWNRFSHESFCL